MILIADDSGSMSGQPAQQVTEGLQDFIAKLQSFGRGEKSYFRILFVKFGDQPHVVHEFADVLQIPADGFKVSGDSGCTNMDEALEMVATKMEQHRLQSELDPAPLVIFWSDGQNTGGDPLPAAQRIKAIQCPCGRAPLVVTCGFGEAERELLEGIATSPEHFKPFQSAQELEVFLGNVGTLVTTAGKSIDQVREEIKEL
ncbi:MAG: VWA domain-containing protein [Verrucomicrobiales bacterium]|nr:VWA domain-containing protein [Verrucomicrobiales bacterium]MCP5527897.1 VWA domain-containing protein [Verrucomicrobiales bacterium]